jgi:hypothetical protein
LDEVHNTKEKGPSATIEKKNREVTVYGQDEQGSNPRRNIEILSSGTSRTTLRQPSKGLFP